MKKTLIFGHKNPDTDSVTATLSLAYLKNKMGIFCEPVLLSKMNKESEFVLNYFKVKGPKLINDVKVKIEDLSYNKNIMIDENKSIYEAYTYMVNNGITGLPVVKSNKQFSGYVSLKEIAADFINGDFDELNSSYDNIINVLNGVTITKFDDEITGTINAVTYSTESLISTVDFNNNQIVIVGNRKNVLNYCLKNNTKLIILVGNHELTSKELKLAEKQKINVIKTSKDTFEVVKIIGLSNYIKTILRNENPIIFKPTDYLTDFLEVSNKLKHTNYPIIDKKNICRGMVTLLDVNKYEKNKVILVDHNEIAQSADGLNEATIMEIVDHHAISSITTNYPVSIRCMKVGSANSVIYNLYEEAKIKIPKDIAGLMLSGILSDTLIFKSPTTTEMDITIANKLAKICKVDLMEYGMKMIKAGSSIKGMSVSDVIHYDYKEYETNNQRFSLSQILTLDYEMVLKNKDEYVKYLDDNASNKNLVLSMLIVTDILNEGSYMIFSNKSKEILENIYQNRKIEQGFYVANVVSRKKQVETLVRDELSN